MMFFANPKKEAARQKNNMPSLLWWGRSDPGYSRNALLLKLLAELGWQVDFFHPLASWAGRMEAFLRGRRRPDLIWVPCFRQTDIAAAARWAGKWQVPLIIDPLISAYEKEVFEREKYLPRSIKAEKRRRWETRLFAKADMVIADTPAHAEYFKNELGVEQGRLQVIYVGADSNLFKPTPLPSAAAPFELLFYGSFLRLHGPEFIVSAAQRTRDLDIKWTLLGDGESKQELAAQCRDFDRIHFEPWIDFARLPERMARASIVLGIFGTSLKADLVIPNKVFQAMAAGRPLITRTARAYPQQMTESEHIGWVTPGNPAALEELVRSWYKDRSRLAARGRECRRLFDDLFSEEIIKSMLKKIMAGIHQA